MTIFDLLNNCLGVILTAIAGLVAAKVIAFFKTKTEESRSKKMQLDLDKAVKSASTTIQLLVEYFNTEFVKELKVLSADGCLSDEDAQYIHDSVRNRLYGILTDEDLEALKSTYRDLDAIFDQWIESAVRNAKTNGGTYISSVEAQGIANQQNYTYEQKSQMRERIMNRIDQAIDTAG